MDDLRQLQQPPAQNEAASNALELLNSRFSTWDTLLNSKDFDDWVTQAQEESKSLKRDLEESTNTLIETKATSKERVIAVLSSAQDAALSRHVLEDDLTELSTELVSSQGDENRGATLLEDLERLQRKLVELENIRSYVGVVDKALNLSTEAIEEFKDQESSNQITVESLAKYTMLQKLVDSVASLCNGSSSPEDAQTETSNIGLVSFLQTIREGTWNQIKAVLSDKLVAAAESLKWPQAVDWASSAVKDRQKFVSIFLGLLKLQELGESLHAPVQNVLASGKSFGLYPIQALVQPIAARFKYHFEGTRETNRLDKPEWYFTHILNAIHQHRSFMDSTVQTLLKSTRYKSINAHREYTRLLFPILIKKMKKSMPELLQDSAHLAQTIYQGLAFDTEVKEDGFSLTGTYEAFIAGGKEVREWEGVTDIILEKKEWFDMWLEGERLFAEAQYDELIHSPDAWQIADDRGDSEEDVSTSPDLRPTISARRVRILVEQISDRYKPLPRYTHRARFLIAIQIPLLEHYHTRISGSLDAFETLTSSLMRAVPGALPGQVGQQFDTKRLTSGVEGLQRLVKAFVSARWITLAMQGWGESLFYLELWKEINEHAGLRAKAESHSSLPRPTPTAATEGTLFDELITQYATLTARSEDLIVQHLVSEVQNSLRSHTTSPWSVSNQDEVQLPSTLLVPVTSFQQQLAFLASTLPASSVTILYRQTSSLIAAYLVERMVFQQSRGKIDASEAGILGMEYRLWLECAKQAVGRTVRKIEAPWVRLRDAATIANLTTEESDALTLKVWDGTQSEFEATAETLGVASLSQGEARHVLRVRIDCKR